MGEKKKNKAFGKDDLILINDEVIAEILDITPRHVRRLVEDGIFEKYAPNAFCLIDTTQKAIAYEKAKWEKDRFGEVDYDLEHALLERIKREKAELQLALMKGQVHASEDVEREMSNMLSAFRAKILAIPTKLAPRITNISDPNHIEGLIRAEINNTLKELSEYNPNKFKNKVQIEIEDDEKD